MSVDLSRALRDAADRAPLRGLDGQSLADRIHRRRTVRTTARAALGVGLVGAVVVAAVHLNGLDGRVHPVPPAVPTSSPGPTSTPTASPSPTPTTTPTVLPVGDPTRPFGACGAEVTAEPQDPVDDRFDIVAELGAASLEAGRPLTYQGSIGADVEHPAAVPSAGPRLAVSRDGVVVATIEPADDDTPAWERRLGAGLEVEIHARAAQLSVCDAGQQGVSVGHALPAGEYEVQPWARVSVLESSDATSLEALDDAGFDQLVRDQGSLRTVLGTPVPLLITGAADLPVQVPQPALDLTPAAAAPACGGPAPTAPGRAAGLSLALVPNAPPVGEVGREVPVDAQAALIYDGPGQLRALLDLWVTYWIVQDGVVVGSTWVQTDASTVRLAMDGGVPHPLDANPLTLTACSEAGPSDVPLPAGTYTVYPSVWTLSLQVHAAGRTHDVQPLSSEPGMVLGAPFTVTVG
ncbi:hypothetical protein [Cellulomonas soli]|uniref:Uncharacterized protein n=1 Tax=Cellulomonas soli TaxID=931535 RepID=A0A512PGE0_9CELL|nr:hypothetical protein [Cellulomonas soli]NYI58119.1 hypothetical protein [Cellulomonas soli]GEP70253.1 hypothetical protein CSO01_29680 [Cellulomonas soli]